MKCLMCQPFICRLSETYPSNCYSLATLRTGKAWGYAWRLLPPPQLEFLGQLCCALLVTFLASSKNLVLNYTINGVPLCGLMVKKQRMHLMCLLSMSLKALNRIQSCLGRLDIILGFRTLRVKVTKKSLLHQG